LAAARLSACSRAKPPQPSERRQQVAPAVEAPRISKPKTANQAQRELDAAAFNISSEAMIAKRRPIGEGIEPMPQESDESRLGRSRLAQFSNPDFYSKLEREARDELELAMTAEGSPEEKNPRYEPSELDVRERAHRKAREHIERLESPEEKSYASKMLRLRYEETANPRAVRAGAEFFPAAEGSNVVQRKLGPEERTGAYDAREEPAAGELEMAGARNRVRRTLRIGNTGLDESIAKAIDGLNEAESFSHERGVSQQEAQKKWKFHLNNLMTALDAKSIMEGEHSTYDPTRHGSHADQPSREEGARKGRYAGSRGAYDNGGASKSMEGKTEQPGALSSEPHEVQRRGLDVIANNEELLNQFLGKFSGTLRTNVQKQMEALQSKPGSKIHSMENGDILRAALKAMHIEAGATQKALSGVRPSQTTERDVAKALAPGHFVRPDNEKEFEQDKFHPAHLDEEEPSSLKINDPKARKPILELMAKIANGTLSFQTGQRESGDRNQNIRSMKDAIKRIASLGIPFKNARRMVRDPNYTAERLSEIMAGLAKISRSPEERIKRTKSKTPVLSSIIEGLGNRNPNTNAAQSEHEIPGAPIPLGLIPEPTRGPTPGRTINSLSELPPPGRTKADIMRERQEAETASKPTGLPTKSRVQTALGKMVEDIAAEHLGEKVNVGGKLATRRDHIREGRLDQSDVQAEMTRLMDQRLREYSNVYKKETKDLAKKQKPSTLDVARRLEAAYADEERVRNDIESGNPKTINREKNQNVVVNVKNEAGHEGALGYEKDVFEGTTHVKVSSRDLHREILQRIRMLEGQIDPEIYKIYKETKDEEGAKRAIDALVQEHTRVNTPGAERISKEADAARRRDTGRVYSESPKPSTPGIPEMFIPRPAGERARIMTTGGSERGVMQPRGREESTPLRVLEKVARAGKGGKKKPTPAQERMSDRRVLAGSKNKKVGAQFGNMVKGR
jgi:hypothetical protein